MKLTSRISIPAMTLLFAPLVLTLQLKAQQPPQYAVTDLGPADSPFSQAFLISDFGLAAGVAASADGTSHATVWLGGLALDISQPGLGGPNSAAGGVNLRGQVVVGGETTTHSSENFCGYQDGLTCLPYIWDFGMVTTLTTLGGPNAAFGMINNLGQVTGYAQNNTVDKACSSSMAVNGTGPFTHDYEAVIWGPRSQKRQLQPLAGDTVGAGLWINDLGQTVGISGTCANTVVPPFTAGPHAVLWDDDGSVHDLGNLGGTVNLEVLAVGNAANAINNLGQITGIPALPGSIQAHPFLWPGSNGKMQDLGLLGSDAVGAGLDINNLGDVVGARPSALPDRPRAILAHFCGTRAR